MNQAGQAAGNVPPDPDDLAALRVLWADAYLVGWDEEHGWHARRHIGGRLITAGSRDALSTALEADKAADPTPDDLADALAAAGDPSWRVAPGDFDEDALAELRVLWGHAYQVGWDAELGWHARRHGGGRLITAATAGALSTALGDDCEAAGPQNP